MKMNRIFSLALVFALLCVSILSGCTATQPPAAPVDQDEAETVTQDQQQAQTEQEEVPEAKKYKIGFSHINVNMAWMAEVDTLVTKKAEEMGIELVKANANNDKQQQIADVENLLMQGIDGLLLAPVDGEAVKPAIQAANEAGVPVVVIIRGTSAEDIVSFITGDDVEAGRMSAQYFADALGGKGNVVELVGALGALPFINRSAGFNEVLANYPDMKLAAQQNAESLRVKAAEVMDTILASNPQIDAIFAANDEMAFGSYNALVAAGRNENVIIATVGGHIETYSAIKNGEITACIAYPTSMGPRGLEILIDYLNGKEVPATEIVPATIITKDNVQSYIDAVS